jgi:hypothetical protein
MRKGIEDLDARAMVRTIEKKRGEETDIGNDHATEGQRASEVPRGGIDHTPRCPPPQRLAKPPTHQVTTSRKGSGVQDTGFSPWGTGCKPAQSSAHDTEDSRCNGQGTGTIWPCTIGPHTIRPCTIGPCTIGPLNNLALKQSGP